MQYLKLIPDLIISISAILILVWIINKLAQWFGNINIMPDDYDDQCLEEKLKDSKE